MFDVVIRNAKLVLEDRVMDGTLAINGGKIAAIIDSSVNVQGKRVLDYEGCYVLPGAIDTHSHVTFCDSFENGSKAAVAGGVTTIIEMPLSMHLETVLDETTFQERIHIGEKECVGDFALWAGVQPENYKNVSRLCELGAVGFKVFMSYAGENYRSFNDDDLHLLMREASRCGALVGIHAENDAICDGSTKRVRAQGGGAEAFSQCRPVLSEKEAVIRACLYAQETGCRVHICHVSSPDVAAIIEHFKQHGAQISFETCPHYLLLTEKDIAKYGTYAKCNPPMRSREEMESYWDRVEKGRVDCIGTDHATYSDEQKSVEFFSAPGGFPGIDLMVPALLDEGVVKRKIPWTVMAQMLSTRPSKFFHLDHCKGAIRVGLDADLAIVSPSTLWRFRANESFYGVKSEHYPYENREMSCKVLATLVRGCVVYENGQIQVADGYGKFVKSTVK